MEFKSQICTTKEQSEKLLALGLKKETADMSYIPIVVNHKVEYRLDCSTPKSIDIPAWSLHRLFEISNSAIHIGLPAIIDRQQPYDYLIASIKDYIMRDCFNKDYLEEKK